MRRGSDFALLGCQEILLFPYSYEGLSELQHEVIDHAVEYVRGEVHTNELENFWSLLKRAPTRTCITVEPFHLFRYLGEQAFRYNNRTMHDGDRFDIVVRKTVGKRLTPDQLTRKAANVLSLQERQSVKKRQGRSIRPDEKYKITPSAPEIIMPPNPTGANPVNRQEKTFPLITLEEFMADLMRSSPTSPKKPASKPPKARKRQRNARKMTEGSH